MKKILLAMMIALMAATASITTVSCAKDTGYDPPGEQTEVYDLALRFRAEEGITETEVNFYDIDLVQIAVDILDVPADENEVRVISFLSDSKPVWIYTPGLQNVDKDTGMCPVAGRSMTTKAINENDQEATLLIIRREY